MGFYYAKERAKFEHEWEHFYEECHTAGMNEEDIQTLYEFDLDWFHSRRRFIEHTQPFPDLLISDENPAVKNNLYRKFPELSTTFDESNFSGRFAWIDCIEDEQMVTKIKKLSQADLTLLTMVSQEGKSQREIAAIQGCSQPTVSKKIRRIKKYLK